jgi:hypothetical protein
MLEATPVPGGVIFTKEGETSPRFRVYKFETVSVTAHKDASPPYTELGVILPGYGRDRGAWLTGDASGVIPRPGRYAFAVDLSDRTMEFRAVQAPDGNWYRVHNANPEVLRLHEWPVNRW